MVSNYLAKIEIKCGKCAVILKRNNFTTHIQSECPIQCPFGCGSFLFRDELKQHEANCANVVVNCFASDVGCIYTTKRIEMLNHESSCNLVPIRPFLIEIKTLKKEVNELKGSMKEVNELKEKMSLLMKENYELKGSMMKEVNELKEMSLLMKEENNELKGKIPLFKKELSKQKPSIFNYSGKIEWFEIPVPGEYTICTISSNGSYSYFGIGGKAAQMKATFTLNAKDKLEILVSQFKGKNYGGGGTFVFLNNHQTNATRNPLIVSGGGGGLFGYDASMEPNANNGGCDCGGTNGGDGKGENSSEGHGWKNIQNGNDVYGGDGYSGGGKCYKCCKGGGGGSFVRNDGKNVLKSLIDNQGCGSVIIEYSIDP